MRTNLYKVTLLACILSQSIGLSIAQNKDQNTYPNRPIIS